MKWVLFGMKICYNSTRESSYIALNQGMHSKPERFKSGLRTLNTQQKEASCLSKHENDCAWNVLIAKGHLYVVKCLQMYGKFQLSLYLSCIETQSMI